MNDGAESNPFPDTNNVTVPTSSEPSVSLGLIEILTGTNPVASVIVVPALSIKTSDP